MEKNRKVLGGFLAAAIGDAMGAATETRSHEQILEYFEGPVTDFREIPDDVPSRSWERGSVTDGFSLAYCTALTLIERNGEVDEEAAEDAVLMWADSRFYPLADDDVAVAIERLKENPLVLHDDFLSYDSTKGTNASAIRISPVGLASGGDVRKAIINAIMMALPLQQNSTSLAASCAVAGAISEAMNEEATVASVIESGLLGAQAGDAYGNSIDGQISNPSVYRRIEMAVDISKKHKDDPEAGMKELAEVIGCGISAAESVPTAFGLFVLFKGKVMDTITAAVNIGGCTPAIATIAGALAGTLSGPDEELLEYLPEIDEVNGFDIRSVSERIYKLGQ